MDSAPTAGAIFVDEVDVVVIAGDGGDGCVAFRREKHVPRGGPAGGDGGNGGSVFVRACESYNTLQHLAGHHHWRAANGQGGMGKDRHGRNGDDVVILVPPGTVIHDTEKGLAIKDLSCPGEQVRVARGGRGGRGNSHFKTPSNQAPHEFGHGEPGQTRKLHLELKLIADAGLIGLPNAGKSTLTSRMSAARPRIAAYPFTTLHPCLGIVEMPGFRRFVLADIPGLIEGAHKGTGLGDEFLRHVERTRVLVHMVDLSSSDGDPAADYHTIRNELAQYSPELTEKPEIIVANKMDLTESRENLPAFRDAMDTEVIPISAVTGQGLELLAERVWQAVDQSTRQSGA